MATEPWFQRQTRQCVDRSLVSVHRRHACRVIAERTSSSRSYDDETVCAVSVCALAGAICSDRMYPRCIYDYCSLSATICCDVNVASFDERFHNLLQYCQSTTVTTTNNNDNNPPSFSIISTTMYCRFDSTQRHSVDTQQGL